MEPLTALGIVISGVIIGLSGWAANGGDSVEKRKTKIKNSYKHSPVNNEIVAASLQTAQVAVTTQSSMWERVTLLEEQQDKMSAEMEVLRQQVQERDKQIEILEKKNNTQEVEIALLKRKLESLREKLKEQGIEITDEELENLI